MNRSVIICEIREIRGKKLFCYQLWVAGETHAGTSVVKYVLQHAGPVIWFKLCHDQPFNSPVVGCTGGLTPHGSPKYAEWVS